MTTVKKGDEPSVHPLFFDLTCIMLHINPRCYLGKLCHELALFWHEMNFDGQKTPDFTGFFEVSLNIAVANKKYFYGYFTHLLISPRNISYLQ